MQSVNYYKPLYIQVGRLIQSRRQMKITAEVVVDQLKSVGDINSKPISLFFSVSRADYYYYYYRGARNTAQHFDPL